MCVPAPACKALLAQATALWPNRLKASDGICGDARHQARKSDHNQGNAVDLTHDPAHGVDAHAIAELVKASGDPRVAYVISNQRIWNPSVSPKWRAYNGSNPHIKHVHISIKPDKRNDVSPWPLTAPVEDEVTEAEIEKVAQRVAAILMDPDHLGTMKHHIVGAAAEGSRLARAVKILEAKK